MRRRYNVRVIAAAAGLIVFLAGALSGGISQNWFLFFAGLLVAIGCMAYVMITGENWKIEREDDTAKVPRG
ncbi:hypothetical protein Skr01_22640 [Sphaerisporangium krabiense]|uniref:Uncharacterized protein n=1 Tax=Sphaerisporangium krabiense TaxID=763782 RepID=A0A7W9DS36_9ACTN|nr:hypothetical protein [Sphaerisporangium krabiense]MBB5628015.1 hypothetical protein [Sphaerisporangium krabiense]GII62179.1 hypothetical protein Skr01_22640 [Sphaerisporangium krabiense]